MQNTLSDTTSVRHNLCSWITLVHAIISASNLMYFNLVFFLAIVAQHPYKVQQQAACQL